MSKVMSVVLHTDVVVPALAGQDDDARLRALWEDGRIIPPVNAGTEDDLVCVLRHPKFGLNREEAYLAAECYLRHCQKVPERPAGG